MCRPVKLRSAARHSLAATWFLVISGCGGTPPAPPAPPPTAPNAATPTAPATSPDAQPTAPGTGTPAAVAPTTSPATPATPADEVRAALVDARTLLEQKKFKEFIENYFPAEALRKMRQNNALDEQAARLAGEPQTRLLHDLIKFLESQTPQISEDGGVATFTVPEDWRDVANAAPGTVPGDVPDKTPTVPQTRATAPLELSTEPVPGYSGELASVLEQAVGSLQADDLKAFIENMFPIGEVQRLRGAEPYAEVLERLEQYPDMKTQMIADLQAAAKTKAVMDETGTVATITLPGRGKNAPERTLQFEQVEGHWRLFNAAGPIRETIAAQLKNEPPELPTQPGRLGRRKFQLERLGTQWRILDISNDLMESASVGDPGSTLQSVQAREARP
jgi:hypothetical protein